MLPPNAVRPDCAGQEEELLRLKQILLFLCLFFPTADCVTGLNVSAAECFGLTFPSFLLQRKFIHFQKHRGEFHFQG